MRARRSAVSISASPASGRASRTFSRIEVEKRCESWPATATVRRTSSCRQPAQVAAADRHSACLGIEEPQQQVGHGRLARAARPDERDPLSRLETHRDAVEHRPARPARSGHARPRVRRPPGPARARQGAAGRARATRVRSARPGGGRRRGVDVELACGLGQRLHPLERRERKQSERRDQHAVEPVRRRAPRPRPRARP